MDILFFTIPLALILALIFIVAFIISVKMGQYDDLKTPSYKILLDDQLDTTKQDKSSLDKGENYE